MSNSYRAFCLSLGIIPLSDILEVLYNQEHELNLTSLDDNDFKGLEFVLKQNFPHLTKLSLSHQILMPGSLNSLSLGLSANTNISALSLTTCNIPSPESISNLVSSLPNTIHFLAISDSKLNDSVCEALEMTLQRNFNLQALILSKNTLTKAPEISETSLLQHLDLSYNPLTFESIISLLDFANFNKLLKVLNLRGIVLQGTAPIKENSSKLLSKSEAIIIKLTSCLKYTELQVLGIEIDPDPEDLLRDLENTIVKHNRSLVSILSDRVNWSSSSLKGHMLGIHRGLKANAWLTQIENANAPPDIKEILDLKQNKHQQPCEIDMSFGKTQDITEAFEQLEEQCLAEFKDIHAKIENFEKSTHKMAEISHRLDSLEEVSDLPKIENKMYEHMGRIEYTIDVLDKKLQKLNKNTGVSQQFNTLESKLTEIENDFSSNSGIKDKLDSLFSRLDSLEQTDSCKKTIKFPGKSESIVIKAIQEKARTQRQTKRISFI